MIKYISPDTKSQILEMWRVCFGDSQPYYDIYFKERYKNESTLAYFEGEKVVASLQLLPYNFTYCDTEVSIAYISGACTLPAARKKGYMGELLKRTFHELEKKNIPLSILVPEEEWLLSFYNKFGYAQTFDKGKELILLNELMSRHADNLHTAYKEFDSLFRNQTMTVQKTFDDFRVVVEEAAGYGFPPKKSLTGMTRIIDARKMLEIFARKYPNKSFSLEVSDEILSRNNLVVSVDKGQVLDTASKLSTHLNLTISDLAQALLGYHTEEKHDLLEGVFPEHQPQIHFMME